MCSPLPSPLAQRQRQINQQKLPLSRILTPEHLRHLDRDLWSHPCPSLLHQIKARSPLLNQECGTLQTCPALSLFLLAQRQRQINQQKLPLFQVLMGALRQLLDKLRWPPPCRLQWPLTKVRYQSPSLVFGTLPMLLAQ